MSSTPNTDVVVVDDESFDSSVTALDKIQRLSNPSTVVYSTIDGDTFEGRLATVAAITDTLPLADNLGTVINWVDVVTQVVEVNDNESGKKIEAVRVILVDADGTAYAAISDGILQSVQTYIGGLGHPSTWPAAGVAVTAVEERARSGYRYMTLKPVAVKADNKK